MIDRLRAAAGTVRVRTTAAAVLMVAVVLLLGAAGLVVALRAVLTDEVEAAAALHASRAARLLESGADPASVVNTAEDEVFIQILRKHDSRTKWILAAVAGVAVAGRRRHRHGLRRKRRQRSAHHRHRV